MSWKAALDECFRLANSHSQVRGEADLLVRQLQKKVGATLSEGAGGLAMYLLPGATDQEVLKVAQGCLQSMRRKLGSSETTRDAPPSADN